MIKDETPLVSSLCKREVFKAMLDDLDKSCTKKVQRRMLKRANPATNKCDVSEAYSPPRMIAMARQLGFKPVSALDLTQNDQNGKHWDVSIQSTQEDTIRRINDKAPCLRAAPFVP